MSESELFFQNPDYCIKEYTRFMIIKRYFIKRGIPLKRRDWTVLYYLIRDFYMLFKFKYSFKKKELTAVFLPVEKRFLNKIMFFRLYLKLLNYIKWTTINIQKLFFFFKKAVRVCTLELVNTNN